VAVRSEYQPYIAQNNRNIDKNPATYRKRQAIIEHIRYYKRQWGFYFVCTKKGIKSASADVGLMFIALNLRRLMNIIDKNAFKKFLREFALLFFAKTALLNPFSALTPTRIFFPLLCFPN